MKELTFGDLEIGDWYQWSRDCSWVAVKVSDSECTTVGRYFPVRQVHHESEETEVVRFTGRIGDIPGD